MFSFVILKRKSLFCPWYFLWTPVSFKSSLQPGRVGIFGKNPAGGGNWKGEYWTDGQIAVKL